MGTKRPPRCPYRRVFLRRIVRPRWSWFAFPGVRGAYAPLRARIALLRRLLRWRIRCIRSFVPGRHFDVIASRIRCRAASPPCCWYCWWRRLRHAIGRSAPMREALAGNKPVSDNATSLNYFVSRVFRAVGFEGRAVERFAFGATMAQCTAKAVCIRVRIVRWSLISSQRRCLRWQTDCFCGFASVEFSASPAERNVIAYVSAHPHEVVGLSVRGFADVTFSSPSSILRF